MKSKIRINSWLSLIAIVAAFMAVSFVVQKYTGFFIHVMGDGGMYGKVLYVVVTIIAVVVAPVSSVPLIAIASGVWGWVWGGALSIIGWLIGASIAFELSRSFGRELILNIMSDTTIERLHRIIPKHYSTLSLILLRMTIPVDILSYALGLFSNVNRRQYYLSTAIGIIPFAFIFAYVGIINYRWQLVLLIMAVLAAWQYKKTHADKGFADEDENLVL